MRNVPEISITRVNLGSTRFNLHAMRCSIVQAIFARDKIPFTPGRYDSQLWGERLKGVLEAHLIIAFASAAVCERGGPFGECDFHLMPGNDWPGDGCAKQVLMLIDGSGPERRPHIVR